MSWVAAGVAVVGGGIQVYQGIQQKKAGKEAEIAAMSQKPEFTIPPEIAKNMSEAEMRAYQGLPDEQKAAFLDNQQRAAQTALRSSSDRRGGLGMISQIQAQQDRSSLQLLQQDVAARDKNILRAQEARNVMASYRDKRFEHEYNEYSSDLDYARAQVGAGMQNIAGGLVTAGSAVQSGIAHQAGGDGLTRAERKLHKQQNNKDNLPTDNNPFTGKQKEQYNRFIQGQGEFSEGGRFGDVYGKSNMLNLTGTEGEITPGSITFQEFKKSQYNTNKPWWKN